jgi:murein DD-endopeptidase MepM/ murein hydrolase activator NlpD
MPKLFWPVPGGHVTSPWGYRLDPITKQPEGHNGIDLRAAEGTPLRAPADGKVLKVWSDALNGHAMKIDVGNNLVLGFAHLQSTAAAEGDSFSAGDVLAHTGGGGPNEGHSTGPHLHLTVRVGGQLTDPLQAATWAEQPAELAA